MGLAVHTITLRNHDIIYHSKAKEHQTEYCAKQDDSVGITFGQRNRYNDEEHVAGLDDARVFGL